MLFELIVGVVFSNVPTVHAQQNSLEKEVRNMIRIIRISTQSIQV